MTALSKIVERFSFDRLRTTLLFLAVAVTACLMPAQHDTWWQLRAGQEMWHSHRLLLIDTFSHTVSGTPWPNHEWLSQVVFYALYAAGGLPLLTLACAAAVTAAWAIVWAHTPASPGTKFLLTAFVIASATTTWSPRPQVLSLLLLAVTMALLRRRRYGWLPFVFFLWANLHGAVLLGVLLLGAALVAAFIEDRGALRRLAVATMLCLVATSLTPLGWQFWTDMVGSLGRIRQIGIDEWAAPRLTSAALVPFWLTATALLALAAVRGRQLMRDRTAMREGHVTLCACALVIVPLALTAVRNVPPFLMLAVPAVGALWAMRMTSAVAPSSPARSAARPRLNLAIAAAATVLAVTIVVAAYASRHPRLHWVPLPAASLAALDACPGNVYNRYDEGGYLIWFAPARKVFLDGRQDPYPPSLIHDQVRVERTGDFADLFGRYGVRCAFVVADSRLSGQLTRAGWRSLYRDSTWAVLASNE